MKIQERLNISPYVFRGFADTFWSDLYVQGCDFFDQHDSRNPLLPETTPIYSQLHINKKETAFITAVATLPGKSRLILDCSDADWPTIQPWWERFRDELIQEGMIDFVGATPTSHPMRAAQERAGQHGFSRSEPPDAEAGPEPLLDWFLGYWFPTGKSFEAFKREYLPVVDPKEVSRWWDKYREKYDVPTLPELKRLREKEQ